MLSIKDITISSALRIRDILGFLHSHGKIIIGNTDDIYGPYAKSSRENELSLGIAHLLGWIEKDSEHYISLTERGISVCGHMGECSDTKSVATYWIFFLRDLFTQCQQQEILVKYAIWGREKFMETISEAEPTYCKDITQIFKYGGLTGTIEENSEQLRFWIWFKQFARDQFPIGSENKEKGDRGESLSVIYEKERTGFPPIRSSIDNDGLGYDLISKISAQDQRPLLIEVKCSTQAIDMAVFHLTEKQFSVCINALNNRNPSWELHLWLLNSHNYRLAVIQSEDLLKHLPLNSGKGIWEICKVPFNAFEDRFIDKRELSSPDADKKRGNEVF